MSLGNQPNFSGAENRPAWKVLSKSGSRGYRFSSEPPKLDASADIFSLINKNNVLTVNTRFTQAATPTAPYDPRQLKLELKLSW